MLVDFFSTLPPPQKCVFWLVFLGEALSQEFSVVTGWMQVRRLAHRAIFPPPESHPHRFGTGLFRFCYFSRTQFFWVMYVSLPGVPTQHQHFSTRRGSTGDFFVPQGPSLDPRGRCILENLHLTSHPASLPCRNTPRRRRSPAQLLRRVVPCPVMLQTEHLAPISQDSGP